MSASSQGIAFAGHGADALMADRPARVAQMRVFHTLDLLRGIGAVFVVLFHAGYIYGLSPPVEGQIVVDLFFIMSGFVIPYRYEADLHRGMALSTFAKIRFIRLYPLFLLGAALGCIPPAIALATGHAETFHLELLGSFPLAVAMLPSSLAFPHLAELYPLNYVAWSLTLELLVNIAYAASFRVWSVRNTLVLAALAFGALGLCAYHYGSLIGGFAWQNWPVGPVRAVYGFAVGLLLYRAYQVRPFELYVPWWLVVATMLLICFHAPPIDKRVWELLLLAVAAPFVIVAAIANEPPKLLHGLCAIGGLYSYVIYSLHAPLIGLLLRVEAKLHLDLHAAGLWEGVAFTVLVMLASIAAHLWFDKPIRRRLSRQWLKRPSPSAVQDGSSAAII